MKLTIHIGTEKTGTTSIQAALAADRNRLLNAGVLYPKLFGSENHMEVAVAAMEERPNDELQLVELGREGCSLSEYSERLRAQLRREMGQHKAHRLIISNEHCHSRLTSTECLERLVELFGVSPEDCEVIVYLRRQDRLAVSVHSTRLKLGGKGDMFPRIVNGELPTYFSFDKLLARYAHVFGRDRLKVRLYERSRLKNGDVGADFYDVAGLGMKPQVLPEKNVSLSLNQALFLEEFNQRFPMIVNGKVNRLRAGILSAIAETRTGVSFRPSRARAESFYNLFKVDNDKVRAAYFPDLERETLFSEDFSDYPELEPPTALDAVEMMRFVEGIWIYHKKSQSS